MIQYPTVHAISLADNINKVTSLGAKIVSMFAKWYTDHPESAPSLPDKGTYLQDCRRPSMKVFPVNQHNII